MATLIAVKDIVDSTLIATGDSENRREFARRLQFALEGLKLMNQKFTVLPEIMHEFTDINTTTLTSDLPSDYLQWKSVGYMIDGKLVRILPDYQLKPFWKTDECGNYIPSAYENPWYAAYSWGVYGAFPDYGWVGGSGASYGVGGGSHNGSFNIVNGQIIFGPHSDFSGNFPLVMWYVGTGWEQGVVHYIDTRMYDALRMWIMYQIELFKKSSGIGDKKESERRFLDALREGKYDIYAIGQHQMADLIRQGTMSSPTF